MVPDDGESAAVQTQRRLSTGQTVELPLECEFTLVGGLFLASARRLSARLPERLSALRVAPRTGAVALASIEYHRVGELDPYDEFAVIVPVVADARTDLLGAQLLGGTVGGYVHYLPVTTEASVALGTEIWGYPKEVADIAVEDVTAEDGGEIRHTAVSIDGERVVSLDVRKATTSQRELTMQSYTEKDGRLLANRTELAGEFGLKPLSQRVSFSLGDHERADDLRGLGIREWSLGRLYAPNMRAKLHPGRPLVE